ncbi:MAG: glutamate--tRNA ligase [Bacteroidetes bacterium]|nr:glutamate--tRNA ligase [Bacteroidota bacterium]HET6245313.1 glutamate--tRNA ligase [Bacteroidia bacterium]
MENRRVRVRFAPSPTGPLHMGGVRTALYNYLFAKKHGGDFLLRIEDTDQNRFVPGAEQYIIESLKWCNIFPDEGVGFAEGDCGPYRQSERKPMYREYAEKLILSGNAYYAFDTTEDLEEMRTRLSAAGVSSPQYNAITRQSMKNSLTFSEDEVNKRLQEGQAYVIRMKIPRNEEIKLLDIIRGWVVVHSSQMDDKVLFKSDGMPTYHLANVVDDYLMSITHVIRGEEWLPSAPLHVLLYRYLGWEEKMPQFAHLPLLLKPDGNGKLSKRDGDRLGFPVFPIEWYDQASEETYSGYREKGFFPQAFVNMLSLLGWNPGTTQEIFSMQELIDAFSLERVNKSGAKFDFEKTKWFNQQYLRMESNESLAEKLKPIILENGIAPKDEFIAKVCGLMKERATFVKDIWNEGQYFFTAPKEYDREVRIKKWKPDTSVLLIEWKNILMVLADFSPLSIEQAFKDFLEVKKVGMGAVLLPFRLTVTGAGAGPSMFDISALLGREEVVARIEKAVEVIELQ